jgi:hypothetical protein
MALREHDGGLLVDYSSYVPSTSREVNLPNHYETGLGICSALVKSIHGQAATTSLGYRV